MTDKILLKRSLVSGSMPTTDSLDPGELAINVPDSKLFLLQSGSDGEFVRSLLTLDVPNTGNILLSGSISSLGAISGNLEGTASAAFVTLQDEFTGSFFGTASAAENSLLLNETSSGVFATTGSNIFTSIQEITDDTNSNLWDNGALVVAGGIGIGKDVNISGSLNVYGIISAVSYSISYITSSYLEIGTSRILLNTDDIVRFSGLSIFDSGSSQATGSILWDSLNNRFIYETNDINVDEVNGLSSLIIAGPSAYDDIGNEIQLIPFRVPIAISDHNISTQEEVSPLRVISGSRELHVENNLVVTGSVNATSLTGSFSGNLDGIAENATSASFAITASYAENAELLNSTSSATFATTGSNTFDGDQIIVGSLNATSFTGSFLGILEGISENAISASYAENAELLDSTSSATFATTGSNIFDGDQIISGSVTAGSFTGSFLGNLSGIAENAISASFAITASYAENAELFDSTSSATFATTGSNTFDGDQIISGSVFIDSGGLFVTGMLEIIGDSILSGNLETINILASDITASNLIISDAINISDGFSFNTIDGLNVSSSIKITGSIDVTEGDLVVNGNISANEITGSFSGSFVGTVEAPLKVSASDNTDFFLDFNQQFLIFKSASENGIVVQTDQQNSVLFGLAENVSVVGDLIIGGDLIIEGDVTEIQTTNLLIKDRFILVNSGSTQSVDAKGGIIVDENGGTGSALFYTTKNSLNRWAFAQDIKHNSNTATPTAYIPAVVDMSVNLHSQSLAIYEKIGNIKIENGDSYIYVTPKWEKILISGSDATLKSLIIEETLEATSITGSLNTNIIQFTSGGISGLEGQLLYTFDSASLNFYTENNTNIPIGKTLYTRVVNEDEMPLPRGTIVHFVSESVDNIPQVVRAIASNSNEYINFVGVVLDDLIGVEETGTVLLSGILDNVDLTDFNTGDFVYVSDSVSGSITSNVPNLPINAIRIGKVLSAGTAPTDGILLVNPENLTLGIKFDEFINNFEQGIVSGSFTGTFVGIFTGSLDGTASVAISSSYSEFAETSSFSETLSGTGSATFATTGSNEFIGSQSISGLLDVEDYAIINNVFYSGSTLINVTGPITDEVIAKIPSGSFDAVHFDYLVKDGVNVRTGIIMATWTDNGVVHSEVSTLDVGDTSTVNLNVDDDDIYIVLTFSATFGTWLVKTSIRAL